MPRDFYRAFDIECATDFELIRKSYPGLDNLGEAQVLEQCVEKYWYDDFPPLIFHKPVSISVLKRLDAATYGPQVFAPARYDPTDTRWSEKLVREFWASCEKWNREGCTLVTFNGRGYDFPVLELSALRYGIKIPWHFQDSRTSYRHRYGPHFDILDYFKNFGAARGIGGLNEFCVACGIPGKGAVSGKDVHGLWANGDFETVFDYNNEDVENTANIFERVREIRGERRTDSRDTTIAAPSSSTDDSAGKGEVCN